MTYTIDKTKPFEPPSLAHRDSVTPIDDAAIAHAGFDPSTEEGAVAYFVHSDDFEDDDVLVHYGKKGMKWGVINSERSGARSTVNAGGGTLGDAHTAAMKSTGHRTVNAVLGDKKYWASTAKIAGVSLASATASAFVPGMLPDKMMEDMGRFFLDAERIGTATSVTGKVAVPNNYSDIATNMTPGRVIGDTKIVNVSDIGRTALTVSGWTLTGAAAGIAGTAASATNTVRALRGNARIRKSEKDLGDALLSRQNAGNEKTRKMLQNNGGIKKSVLHDGTSDDGHILEHAASSGRTIQEFYASMTPDQKATVDLCVAVAIAEEDISSTVDIVAEYNKLPFRHKCFIDFTVGQAVSLPAELAQSDMDGEDDAELMHLMSEHGLDSEDGDAQFDFLMQCDDETRDTFLAHYGKKGMKWGVIRSKAASVASSPGGKIAGKIAIRSGGTAALLALGVPGVIAGATVTVLATNPEVASAVSSGAKAAGSAIKESGSTAMSNLKDNVGSFFKSPEPTTGVATPGATQTGVTSVTPQFNVGANTPYRP